MHIYRDMWVVHEFETMLNSIKTTGQYEGIEYNHPGPAILASARKRLMSARRLSLVWTTFLWFPQSHGEILAKGCPA